MFVLVAGAGAATAAPSSKLNVVFILSDNVGYGDLGPYEGGEFRGSPTPCINCPLRTKLRCSQVMSSAENKTLLRG
jgi:hypothetical protein